MSDRLSVPSSWSRVRESPNYDSKAEFHASSEADQEVVALPVVELSKKVQFSGKPGKKDFRRWFELMRNTGKLARAARS